MRTKPKKGTTMKKQERVTGQNEKMFPCVGCGAPTEKENPGRPGLGDLCETCLEELKEDNQAEIDERWFDDED